MATGGYFDPTVRGLLVTHGIWPPERNLERTVVRVDSLLDYVGFDKVSLGADNKI